MTKLKEFEKRTELYKKLENSLRDFFSSTDFCYQNCFSKDEAVIGKKGRFDITGPGNEGCCHSVRDFTKFEMITYIGRKRSRKFESMFQTEQKNNIKKSFDQTGTCKYHSDSGCSMKNLKTPVCNSWVCEPYELSLGIKYNIGYSGDALNDNVVKGLLGIIYDEEVDEDQVFSVIEKLSEATARIKNHKEGVEYSERIRI